MLIIFLVKEYQAAKEPKVHMHFLKGIFQERTLIDFIAHFSKHGQ